jgi:hypothetical protein
MQEVEETKKKDEPKTEKTDVALILESVEGMIYLFFKDEADGRQIGVNAQRVQQFLELYLGLIHKKRESYIV